MSEKRETAIDLIDNQEWLKDLAENVQPAVRETLRSLGPLKDILHGTWLGHPLHPVMTDIPIGAWTAAMVFDALEMVAGDGTFAKASDVAVGIGLAGAVGSALTGMADWSETYGRGQRVGAMHAILNIGATVLYAGSLTQRIRGSRRSGVGLSMLGYAVSSFAAWLGGHLVYGEQIGVDHTATADADKPEKWTVAASDADLVEGKPKRVMAGNVAVLLVRQKGTIRALTDTCTHLGGPLSEGELDDEGIRCPWHGSRFCLADGSVLEGPATFPERLFDVRVKAGNIEVRAES